MKQATHSLIILQPTLLSLSFVFLGLHPRHVEVPRLGVESELWPRASTTATATRDLGRVCDLHHSSQQCQMLNPLSKGRDPTCILMVPGRIHFHCASTGTPYNPFLITEGSLTSLTNNSSKKTTRPEGVKTTANWPPSQHKSLI